MSTVRSRVAYILAASHSGSTLLAFLLGSHPRMCTVGELKLGKIEDRENYLCSCRTPLLKCGFWQAVGERIRAQGVPFSRDDAAMDYRSGGTPYVRRLLSPLHRGPFLEAVRDGLLALSPQWRRDYPALQRRNAALIEAVLAETGAQVIVDSSKTGVRLKYLCRNDELDVRALRLIRDGRAVALTYMEPGEFADAKDPTLRGGGSGNSLTHVMPMERAAMLWRRSNEEADAVVASMPAGTVFQLRYEELCKEPTRVLNEVYRFLGVDLVDTWKDFKKVDHHVVGNGMRLDDRSEIVLDERWKTALNAEHLREFERVAGNLNKKYGYS